MKISIFLLALAAASAAPAKAEELTAVYAYGLACPGQTQLISGDRQRINSAGGSIPARFATFEEESAFHISRMSERSRLNGERVQAAQNKVKQIATFKDGIRFDPINLGLPAQINGCEVVPVIVRAKNPATDEISYVVNNEAWVRLYPIDALFNLLKMGLDKKEANALEKTAFLLDDSTVNLSLKEFSDRAEAKDLQGLTFRGSDFVGCDFLTDDIPSKCRTPSLNDRWSSALGEKLMATREVTFWPDGTIAKAYLPQEATVPRDLKNLRQRVQCNITMPESWTVNPVLFTREGKLKYCANTFIDDTSPIEMVDGFGRDKRTKAIRFVHLTRWTQFDDLEIPSVPNHEIARDLGDQCMEAPRSPLLVEFHPNGHFKSGLTVDRTTWKYEYLELDEKGKVTKKMPFDCRDAANNYLPTGEDFTNDSDKDIEWDVRKYGNGYFTEVTALLGKPGCLTVKKDANKKVTHIKLGAGCFVFAKDLGVGRWK